MAIGRSGAPARHLHALWSGGALGGLADGQLLERFDTSCGEVAELAFAALVERHGPMVLRVCRGILRDEQDAQDAFQATFVVLVRRRRALWLNDSLGPWLYGVARRVASSARAAAVRRRRHERRAAELAPQRPCYKGHDFGLEESLHEEIGRLPERLRAPVLLCLLEGLSHEQASRHLGWPVGTVKSRLATGRERLRAQLIRRGLAPGAVPGGAALAGRPVLASVPTSLVESTATTALRLAAGRAGGGLVRAATVLLACLVQRSHFMTKSCFVVAALALGVLGVSPRGEEGQPVSRVELTFVDLQPRGNHRLVDALGELEGNDLAALKPGRRWLGESLFQVGERIIRVRGELAPEPPSAVRKIAIGATFDTLHILHSTMFGGGFGVADGTVIGAYVVHYTDDTQVRIPIIYGQDVRDWWRSSDTAEPSRGKLAWSGKNEAAGADDEIRLFSSQWKNPYPRKKVATLDLETRNTPAAPFLVALTLERTHYYVTASQ